MLDFDKLVKAVGGMPQLAALAGRSRTAVYHWRKSKDMRVADLVRVCEAKGLNPKDFIVGNEENVRDKLELD